MIGNTILHYKIIDKLGEGGARIRGVECLPGMTRPETARVSSRYGINLEFTSAVS